MIFKFKSHLLTIYLGFVFMQMSCKKADEFNGDTYSGSKVIILGHGGMGIYFNAPQNSYESISTALSIGCDGSEFDVQITKDSILVAYHNGELEDHTTCDGKISEQNWEDIKDCKYTKSVKSIFLMSVEELFEKTPHINDYYFSFDCKEIGNGASQQRLLRAIRRLSEKYKMVGHIFIEGPYFFLDNAKSLGLGNKLFLFSNNDDNPIEKAKQKYEGISTVMDISKEDSKRAADNNVLVMLWDPINYSQNKTALSRKPDIIQTDDPISILKLLKRFNYENVTP